MIAHGSTVESTVGLPICTPANALGIEPLWRSSQLNSVGQAAVGAATFWVLR
jgi:hypothetical protein